VRSSLLGVDAQQGLELFDGLVGFLIPQVEAGKPVVGLDQVAVGLDGLLKSDLLGLASTLGAGVRARFEAGGER